MKSVKQFFVSWAVALFCGAGCASTVPSAAYVAADRQTKRAVEPMLKITASEHPELAPSVADTLESWETRVKSAEATLQKPLAK